MPAIAIHRVGDPGSNGDFVADSSAACRKHIPTLRTCEVCPFLTNMRRMTGKSELPGGLHLVSRRMAATFSVTQSFHNHDIDVNSSR
jgi:hypothetical protein